MLVGPTGAGYSSYSVPEPSRVVPGGGVPGGVDAWKIASGGGASVTPTWQTNLGQAIPAGLAAAQQFFGNNQSTQSQAIGKRTWNQGMYNQLLGNMPELSQYMAGANAMMPQYQQFMQNIQGSLGPTDTSELRQNWRNLSNLQGEVYKPFEEAVGTYKDYRNQLSTGTTGADIAMGRQLKEASAQQMLANPYMTSAQRGATEFENRAKAAEGRRVAAGQEFAGATQGLAGAQQALGGARLSGIQSAGQLAAQISGFRAADMERIIQGNAMLSQMAMNNPQQAAYLAVMSTKMGLMNMSTGTETQGSSSGSGGTFNKVLGVASVAAPIIIAI